MRTAACSSGLVGLGDYEASKMKQPLPPTAAPHQQQWELGGIGDGL